MNILISILLALNMFPHENTQIIKGQVSFVTSSNVYVKFENTRIMSIGDKLYLPSQKTACLQIISKSSTSCVCISLDSCTVIKGDEVFFLPPIKQEPKEVLPNRKRKLDSNVVASGTDINSNAPEQLQDSIKQKVKKKITYKEKIRGRVSLASYSNFASAREDRHRFITRFSLDASHINNSKLSFESYLNYRIIQPGSAFSAGQKNSFARIYNLGFRYDLSPGLSFSLGRKINPKTPSVGAIDGLQVEKQIGNQYVGAIVGFRPDVFDYSFNPNLLEYGAYVGQLLQRTKHYSQATLGFIEQRNSGKIDRRYSYLQYSSTFFKKLSIFSSLELDVYNKIGGISSSQPRLTNLYLASSYRFSRFLNFMFSYDSRKRVLYYETFQTEIERLLDDDIARQGIRFRVNIRPFKKVLTGLSYAKRFQNDTENKSDNVNGFATITRIPKIGGQLSLTYNLNASNYLESKIWSIRHSRSLLKRKLYADFYYRFVNYTYANNPRDLKQNYFGTYLSYNFTKSLMFSVSGEFSVFNEEKNYRINAKIIQRLYKKSK